MNSKCVKILFVVSLVFMVFGSFMAKNFHTDGGDVQVRDISFVTDDGAHLRALLYIPKQASSDNKLPAVVGAHGFNNTAEVQGLNAVELSRRGIVFLAVDEHGHGKSSFADPNINKGIVPDMGVYAAMQYLGTLPYVDTGKVGLVGHSMGGSTIQNAAIKAWTSDDSNVVKPVAILPTAQAWAQNADGSALLGEYPVNVGLVYGQFDEWAKGMWGVDKGSQINTTAKAAAIMGFENPEYGILYKVGDSTPLSRAESVEVAKTGEMRIMYQPPVVHPRIHMSAEAARNIIDFFEITLLDGKTTIPNTNQNWLKKEYSTFLSFIGYFIFITTLGLLLLRLPFFQTIVRPEPQSPSRLGVGKSTWVYIILYIVCLLPAPLFYNWVTGYPIDIQAMGRTVPTLFPANPTFPMPTANGLVLFNLITGAIMLMAFVLTYKLYMKKNGATFGQLGISLPGGQIFKALLLAIAVFFGGYIMLAMAEFFFNVDFRFYTFSIKVLTAPKVWIFIKYVPFWAFAFVISSLTLNSFTRINGAKEWVNILLLMLASCGGLAVFCLLDYGALLSTGIKMWTVIPGQGTTSALAGVLLWGLLFILPISAVIARIFFKATGSIWVGGFVNAFIVTFFAISNTVIAGGVWYL